MGGRRRVRTGLLVLAVTAVVGVAWYWLVEGFGIVDALYQVAVTVSTVGSAEAQPFDTSARAFTTVFVLVAVAAAAYTAGVLFEEYVESQMLRFGRRRMDRRIAALSGHVILCGFGRVGTRILHLLSVPAASTVVVDRDEDRCRRAADDGYLVVVGDSTEDETLKMAGIERAGTLVVCLASDADAISTVLSARVLNPEARIVARANAESSEAKLHRAGVDHVVNPLSQGAQRMAAFAQQPAVADFLDVVVHDGSLEYRLEEVVVPAGSRIAGSTLADAHLRARTGALVLAVRLADGTFLSNPDPATVLAGGVTLIVIGAADQLRSLEDLLAGH